jgi:hypothetical protein
MMRWVSLRAGIVRPSKCRVVLGSISIRVAIVEIFILAQFGRSYYEDEETLIL